MKLIILKLFIVICCGDYVDGNYHYEVKPLDDMSTTYTVYSTIHYNVGDTIQFKIK